MIYSGLHESINAQRALGLRPFCPCCGGGARRKGYSCTKAASREHSAKARKPRSVSRESIRFFSPSE